MEKAMHFIELMNELFSHPLFVLIMIFLFFLVALRRMKLDFPAFVIAVNQINSQPFALLVLIIGFWMLVECKKFNIDTTIAGGVIGVASNMLQSQIKDAAHLPGASVHTETRVDNPPLPVSSISEEPLSTMKKSDPPLVGRAYNQPPK